MMWSWNERCHGEKPASFDTTVLKDRTIFGIAAFVGCDVLIAPLLQHATTIIKCMWLGIIVYLSTLKPFCSVLILFMCLSAICRAL